MIDDTEGVTDKGFLNSWYSGYIYYKCSILPDGNNLSVLILDVKKKKRGGVLRYRIIPRSFKNEDVSDCFL